MVRFLKDVNLLPHGVRYNRLCSRPTLTGAFSCMSILQCEPLVSTGQWLGVLAANPNNNVRGKYKWHFCDVLYTVFNMFQFSLPVSSFWTDIMFYAICQPWPMIMIGDAAIRDSIFRTKGRKNWARSLAISSEKLKINLILQICKPGKVDWSRFNSLLV